MQDFWAHKIFWKSLSIWRPVLPVFPIAQRASLLISTLNSLQVVLKVSDSSGWWLNPYRGRWQVPIFSWQHFAWNIPILSLPLSLFSFLPSFHCTHGICKLLGWGDQIWAAAAMYTIAMVALTPYPLHQARDWTRATTETIPILNLLHHNGNSPILSFQASVVSFFPTNPL